MNYSGIVKDNRKYVRELFSAMPQYKKDQLSKCMDINEHLTSVRDMGFIKVRVYKELIYIQCTATRCSFVLCVDDSMRESDDFVFMKRKPRDSKLNFLYELEYHSDFLFDDMGF